VAANPQQTNKDGPSASIRPATFGDGEGVQSRLNTEGEGDAFVMRDPILESKNTWQKNGGKKMAGSETANVH